MTRKWIFAGGGWEHGPIRRLRSANANQGACYIEGPYGHMGGSGTYPPEKTIVGSGKFAFRSIVAGFSALEDAITGHVFARTQDWIFWCGRIALTGFNVPGDLAVNDLYVFARCSEELDDATQAQYIGPGIKIVSLGPPVTFAFTILLFDKDGSYNQDAFSTSATKTVGSTVYNWVIALDTSESVDNCWLYIDGTPGAATNGAGIETTGHILHDNRYVVGKTGEAGAYFYKDDPCSCDGASIDDLPSKYFRQILYQPIAEVVDEDEFTGDETDVDDENDDGVGDGDTDANVITPTAEDDLEIFTYPDLVSEEGETATVEAVLLVWEQDTEEYVPHKPMARISGGDLQDLSGDYGNGYTKDGGLRWYARLLNETPEASPVAWTPAKFNALQAGLKAIDTKTVGEFYAIPLGEYIARPAATGAAPPTGRRRWPGGVF